MYVTKKTSYGITMVLCHFTIMMRREKIWGDLTFEILDRTEKLHHTDHIKFDSTNDDASNPKNICFMSD